MLEVIKETNGGQTKASHEDDSMCSAMWSMEEELVVKDASNTFVMPAELAGGKGRIAALGLALAGAVRNRLVAIPFTMAASGYCTEHVCSIKGKSSQSFAR